MLGFEERGKAEYPEKKPLGANSTHITASMPGFKPGPHWWEASALTTAASLAPRSNGRKLVGKKSFEPTTPNISFFCDRRSVAQQCWIRLQTSSNVNCWGHARRLHMVFKVLWVVSFPRCSAGTNIVGSCCIRVHSTANTEVKNSKHC